MAENENAIEKKKPSVLSWAALGLAAIDLVVTLILMVSVLFTGMAVVYIGLVLVLLAGFLPLLLGAVAFFTAKGEKISKRNALIAVIVPLVMPVIFIAIGILRYVVRV